MVSQFIDRRLNGKHKSAVNRQRFIQRFKNQIKKAVSDTMAKRSITDIDNAEKIVIPAKDTREPIFGHGAGGITENVLPGNKKFIKHDRVKRPPSGGGSGQGEASNQGEGEDDFVFELSREEFLELFFDDLALPDLIRKELAEVPNYKTARSGYSLSGIPANLNISRTMRHAKGRRVALSASYHKRLKEAEIQLDKLRQQYPEDDPLITKLKQHIAFLINKIAAIPFVDTHDMRFNLRTIQPEPATRAVMFCVMDVSGSMDEEKKELAKRFFILLHLFLTKNYEKIELVFLRHHTSAKVVNEQEFFYSRETGGTVVSSALELLRDTINANYSPDEWNIYVAQASDGDNWNADSPYCAEILIRDILHCVQYFAYIEIMARHHQSLWEAYHAVGQQKKNLAMQSISAPTDIYPVMRNLFKSESIKA